MVVLRIDFVVICRYLRFFVPEYTKEFFFLFKKVPFSKIKKNFVCKINGNKKHHLIPLTSYVPTPKPNRELPSWQEEN